MITLFTLSILCLVAVVVFGVIFGVIFSLIGLPLMILFSLLPWLLRVIGVVLLIKALFDKPVKWENFIPAVIAFVLAWIF